VKLFKFNTESDKALDALDNQKCPSCGYRFTNVYTLADSREEAERLHEPGDYSLCGDCMSELLADGNYKIESADAEKTHCIWLPDAETIEMKIGRKPTEQEVVNVRHAFEKGIEGQVDWFMALDCAIEQI
jgi:predicted DNA-binding protein